MAPRRRSAEEEAGSGALTGCCGVAAAGATIGSVLGTAAVSGLADGAGLAAAGCWRCNEPTDSAEAAAIGVVVAGDEARGDGAGFFDCRGVVRCTAPAAGFVSGFGALPAFPVAACEDLGSGDAVVVAAGGEERVAVAFLLDAADRVDAWRASMM
jgi:hypothetical protein